MGTARHRTAAGVPYPEPADETRSRNMRAIRGADTKPEVALRSALHRLGFRFRKNLRIGLSGVWVRPDIVFTARKVAVFVDGCFWHSCPEHSRAPVRNDWYWTPKLQRTVERDRRADSVLQSAGWHVIRVWEHSSLPDAVATVVAVLQDKDGA